MPDQVHLGKDVHAGVRWHVEAQTAMDHIQ